MMHLTLLVLAALQGWLGLGVTWQKSEGHPFLHVRGVAPGGPAEVAGIRPLDVITAINGKPVNFPDELAFFDYLKTIKAGERIALTIRRGDKTFVAKLVAGELSGDRKTAWDLGYEAARRKAAAERARH